MYFLYSLLLTLGVVALLPRFIWDAAWNKRTTRFVAFVISVPSSA
jgi:hypothetical protein